MYKIIWKGYKALSLIAISAASIDFMIQIYSALMSNYWYVINYFGKEIYSEAVLISIAIPYILYEWYRYIVNDIVNS